MIRLCQRDPYRRLGLTFESLKPPTFSSLLKKTSFKQRIQSMEDALHRSLEIWSGEWKFVGVVFDVSETYYVYTGHPIADEMAVDLLRITLHDGNRRYICSLDTLLGIT